jgi:hypothetical protein
MAAVANSSDPNEIRVACPFCSGFIHPIAGRCKHCKQDLGAHRSRLHGGPANLPALAAPLASPVSGARITTPMPIPALDDSHGTETERLLRRSGHSWARNWPLIVILAAVAAMIVALILLLLPQRDRGTRRIITPPSNDPMDTQTLPKDKSDPWSSPAPPARPLTPRDPSTPPDDSPAVPVPVEPALPDESGASADPADPGNPDPDSSDPFDDGTGMAQRSGVLPRSRFLTTAIAHLCRRMASCVGDQVLRAMCSRMNQTMPAIPDRCYEPAKAQACLRAIDETSCDQTSLSMSVLQLIPSCLELISC